jgi:flagellar hook-associated protein 3 FlgL
MAVGNISTKALNEANRLSVMKLQQRLAVAQREVASGRLADVGVTLGARTSETVSLRQELTRLDMTIDTNATVASRLNVTQEALSDVQTTAENTISTLLTARNSATGPRVAKDAATAALRGLTDVLNTTFAGAHLFAGINTDVQPVQDYFATPTPANRQAVADAFQATFGFSQTDPQVANITPAQIESFIDTTFSDLFEEPAWSANWSDASSENVESRISTFEITETSANANEEPFRKLAKVYTMVSDLGIENMNTQAFTALIDKATALAGEAVQDVGVVQSRLGAVQERVANADAKMEAQIDILTTRINGLEAVDPFEAAVRVTSLLTQLETSFALTARVQNLTILNYI